MATTFLNLTNKLLRRLNEAELTSSQFASARNIQASAKDFIADTIDEINAAETAWDFNYLTGTQVLVVGQESYDFPADANTVDWNSFYVVADGTLNTKTTQLIFLKKYDYYKSFRPEDEDAGAAGIDLPRYVYQGPGQTFGVTESPDKAYTIKFDYYADPLRLETYDDVSTIPSKYDYVIIDGALRHFYAHKDNTEEWDRAETRFKNSLNQMRLSTINKQDYMTDTRVNFGGFSRSAFHD